MSKCSMQKKKESLLPRNEAEDIAVQMAQDGLEDITYMEERLSAARKLLELVAAGKGLGDTDGAEELARTVGTFSSPARRVKDCLLDLARFEKDA